MKEINKTDLLDKIKTEVRSESFNIYDFVFEYLSKRK